MKCSEAKLRKSSIESVAARLCDEALLSMSAVKQVLGDLTSPGRVSTQLQCIVQLAVSLRVPGCMCVLK